jgi:hypothetical protein
MKLLSPNDNKDVITEREKLLALQTRLHNIETEIETTLTSSEARGADDAIARLLDDPAAELDAVRQPSPLLALNEPRRVLCQAIEAQESRVKAAIRQALPACREHAVAQYRPLVKRIDGLLAQLSEALAEDLRFRDALRQADIGGFTYLGTFSGLVRREHQSARDYESVSDFWRRDAKAAGYL